MFVTSDCDTLGKAHQMKWEKCPRKIKEDVKMTAPLAVRKPPTLLFHCQHLGQDADLSDLFHETRWELLEMF